MAAASGGFRPGRVANALQDDAKALRACDRAYFMEDLRRVCREPFPAFRSPFKDTLQHWADEHLPLICPSPALVRYYHELLLTYLRSEDPLFVVRWVSNTPRRRTYRTTSAHQFLATDNAPAVFMHSLLYHGIKISPAEFVGLLRTLPAHFHDVPRAIGTTAYSKDWSVRHILNVKDGDVDFQSWDRDVLTWRFIRNVHPANYFCFPKEIGSSLGEDPRVTGFFAQKYAGMYSETWEEFLAVAKGEYDLGEPDGTLVIQYGGERFARRGTYDDPAVRYSAAGLRFVRDRIEPLGWEQSFRIDIPAVGAVQFTKAEFYAVFPNVVKPDSCYWTYGFYVYTTVPRKALAHRVD
jgi:hypothetical protein